MLASEGHVLRSHCDTEIIPHLYERYGVEFAEQLRGMFAIAVWDGARRRACSPATGSGSSPSTTRSRRPAPVRVRAQVPAREQPRRGEIDYEAIDAYLTLGFVPAPRTLLAGVSKLLPGHRLVVERGTCGRSRTGVPRPRTGSPATPSSESAEDAALAARGIRRLRLISDVPLGAMLRGGLDSSLIVALMARRMGEPVKTFSVGFREAGARTSYRRAVRRGSSSAPTTTSSSCRSPTTTSTSSELVWHLDEPVADLSSLGFLALSELAAEHVTVALSGQGADELFGGYGRTALPRSPTSGRGFPPLLPAGRRATRPPMAHAPGAPHAAARARVSGSSPYERRGSLAALRDPAGPLAGSTAARHGSGRGEARRRSRGSARRPLYVDSQLGLVDDMLHYFDRTSMAHSLEVRVPFLDHDSSSSVRGFPPTSKSDGLDDEAHPEARGARARARPDDREEEDRIRSRGSRPLGRGAGGERHPAICSAEPRAMPSSCVFDAVRALVDEQARTQGYAVSQSLLRILILEVWLSVFVPRATARVELSMPGVR